MANSLDQAASILSSLSETLISTNSHLTPSLAFDDTSTEIVSRSSSELSTTGEQSSTPTFSELSTQSSDNGPPGTVNHLVTDSTIGFFSGEEIITSSMPTMLVNLQSSDEEQTTPINTSTQSSKSSSS